MKSRPMSTTSPTGQPLPGPHKISSLVRSELRLAPFGLSQAPTASAGNSAPPAAHSQIGEGSSGKQDDFFSAFDERPNRDERHSQTVGKPRIAGIIVLVCTVRWLPGNREVLASCQNSNIESELKWPK